MQRDYFWPGALSDRQHFAAWKEEDAEDMWQRVNEKVRATFEDYQVDYLESNAQTGMRRGYRILLPA